MSNSSSNPSNSLNLGNYGSETTSIDNFATGGAELSRADRLEENKKYKQDLLSQKKQFANLDNSFTELEDGTIESNRNKVWNDLSDQEFQDLYNYTVQNKTLTTNEDGTFSFSDGTPYKGRTRRLYAFGSQGEDNEAVKLGIARGDLDSSKARYIPNEETGYGWAPGFRGVDTDKELLDVLVPENVAKMIEGVGHGRKKALEGRAVKDLYTRTVEDKFPSFDNLQDSEAAPKVKGLFGKALSAIADTRGWNPQDSNNLINFMGKVAEIESNSIVDRKQGDSEDGIGRGKYQFETSKGSGASKTAANRLFRGLPKLGIDVSEIPEADRAELASDDPDFSKLSEDVQDLAFLVDKAEAGGVDLTAIAKGEISPADAWLTTHWKGSEEEAPGKLAMWQERFGNEEPTSLATDVVEAEATATPTTGTEEDLFLTNIKETLEAYKDFQEPFTREQLGSGSSEYYVNKEALFGKEGEYNEESGKKLFKQYIRDLDKKGRIQDVVDVEADRAARYQANRRWVAENASAVDQTLNTLQGFGATFVGELLVNPLDAIGDITGAYDLGTEEEKSEYLNEAFGYNPEAAAMAMEEIGKQWDIAANSELSAAERARAAGNGILEAFTTPEMLGTSLGALLAWVSPGKFFTMLGKGTKYTNTVNRIDKLADAGKLTKQAARAKKVKAFTSVDGAKSFLTKQSGFIASALGNVNNQYEEFVQNNDGVELTGVDKAKWFAGRFAIQMVNQNLDKFTDVSIIKNPGLITAIVPAIKGMTEKEFANVAKTIGKGVGKSVENMGKEAAQEYTQTMMELFNSRFGSAQFKDVEEFTAFITDERNTREAGIAALAGAGGSQQFEVVGSIGPAIGLTGQAVGSVVRRPSKNKAVATPSPDSEEVIAKVNEVIQANKEARASTTNPAAAYYAGQGSGDAEIVQEAKAEARQAQQSILEGTNSIFNSDEEFSIKLGKLDPFIEIAVAENPELTIDEIQQSIIKGLKAQGNKEQEAEVSATVAKAHSAGLEFASIKPLTETAKDVESGTKGFITYFTSAKAALAEGNTAKYEKNIEALDNFYNYQSTKSERLKAGVDQVKNLIENEVDILVKQGKASSRKEALDLVLSNKGEQKVKVRHSDNNNKSSEVKYSDVITRMLDPSYNKGIYSLISNIDREVEAIGNTYNSLVQGTDTRPAAAETATVEETPVTTEDTIESVEAAPTIEGFTDEELALMEEDIAIQESLEREDFGNNEEVMESFTDEEMAALEARDFEAGRNVEGFTDEELEAFGEAETFSELGEAVASPEIEKEATVAAFNENKTAVKAVKKRITERRAELRASGVTTLEEVVKDPEMVELFAEKDRLEGEQETTFVSKLKDNFSKRVEAFKSKVTPSFSFTSYATKGKPVQVKTSVDSLINKFKPTGFTLSDRNRDTATNNTKNFADKVLGSLKIKDGEFNVGLGTSATNNPLTLFLFDENGNLNYNTVEALQAASYEFLVQEASNLLGVSRETEDVADLFGITSEQVTPEMFETFANGGMTVKLAAPAIGEKLITNLGITVEGVQNKEALATALGMAALRTLEGDFITIDSYSEEGVLYGSVDYIKGLPSMYYTFEEKTAPSLQDAREQLSYFEEALGVDLDKGRTYRRTRTKGNRKVYIHKSEYQEAPKDHKDTVNRLENTAFSFNSGNDVLLEMFANEDGILDEDKLIERILGSENKITNADGKARYEAQKEAVKRSIKFYQEAKEDIGDGSLFFNWFIAKNQRIHLDSNNINPQNDKHLARWLLTTNNSQVGIKKSEIKKALNGKRASKEAIMFIYGIVQAFDGAKGIAGVDKNNQKEVIATAKKLLEDSTNDTLMGMANEADHVGHAALAISNIRKYMDSDGTVNSDMVMEVDGLTNGFAFRAMQFPLGKRAYEWLEKVGVIRSSSKFYGLESMNGARDMDQEDVYISVGSVFQDNIIENKENLSDTSKKWIGLFEEFGKLPDFADKDDNNVKKFVRNLMKSPVMIFNYAAGKEKIAGGLVNDQVMGTNYLSGRGLIDALTEVDGDKNYLISESKLKKLFGQEKGSKYHKAREALNTQSITSKSNPIVMQLRVDLTAAVDGLYREALEDTLSSLFSEQTEVNKAITEVGQLMFNYFKENYDLWRKSNPTATEEEKTEYLRGIAQVVPGVAGASTDDQLNKVTFLKSVLEPTNNYVVTNVGGKRMSSNTISRAYGEPGVGPAVLLILSSDSSTMAKSLNQAYNGKKGFGALPIHDAIILGANEMDTISFYNMNFYSVNRNYSIMQEFVSAVEGLEKLDPNVKQKKIFNPVLRKMVTFDEIKSNVIDKNRQVQEARKELFKGELKIGQMVGPEGTMVTVNPEEVKTKAKEVVAKASESLLARFKEKRIKNALGKDYAKALSDIEKMLEGCK